jgi:hypothetical protein
VVREALTNIRRRRIRPDKAPHRQTQGRAARGQDRRGLRVTDILKERGLRLTGVVIHGGESSHRSDGAYHVPKKDVVAALEVPFDAERLKVAQGLELWGVLKEELQNFRRKQNPKTSHVSFEHWRETDHDDLVLAAALPCC